MSKKYRQYLGPSQFACVLGVDGFQTADDLQREIEEGYQPTGNYATAMGNNQESIALYYYQKIYGGTQSKPRFMVDPQNPRIGGIADSLLDQETGLEIKCHVKRDNVLTELPLRYLIQVAGYMYLYQRKNWVLMSCYFGSDQKLEYYAVHKVTWDQVKDRWETEWYPSLTQFTNMVKWVRFN
jgi:predicted phage-related endonuclease